MANNLRKKKGNGKRIDLKQPMYIINFPEATCEQIEQFKEKFQEIIDKKDKLVFTNAEFQLYKLNKGVWVEIKNIEVKVKEPILKKLSKYFLKKLSKKGGG